MAQPYQDLQGNWFVAGRAMTPEELGLHAAAQQNMAQPAAQAQINQAPQAIMPGAVPQGDMIAAGQANAAAQKRTGLNPIGKSLDWLFGGK